MWADDIIVLDSGSSDRTVDVAREFGCRVVVRRLTSWAEHQNWALANLDFQHQWVLNVDADERVTKELAESIASAVSDPGDRVGFRMQRRDYLEGRWLKHVQATAYYLRLYKPKHIRFERLVNPVTVADGPVGELMGFLDHYPFSKGYSHWLERHNSYSTLEAKQIIVNRLRKETFSLKKAIFSKDFNQRRYHQKELFYRLPARPFAKFLILYVLKRGFLDGTAGLTYATLQAFYEYMIVLKSRDEAFASSHENVLSARITSA